MKKKIAMKKKAAVKYDMPGKCFMCNKKIEGGWFTYCGKDFCHKCEEQLRVEMLEQVLAEAQADLRGKDVRTAF